MRLNGALLTGQAFAAHYVGRSERPLHILYSSPLLPTLLLKVFKTVLNLQPRCKKFAARGISHLWQDSDEGFPCHKFWEVDISRDGLIPHVVLHKRVLLSAIPSFVQSALKLPSSSSDVAVAGSLELDLYSLVVMCLQDPSALLLLRELSKS